MVRSPSMKLLAAAVVVSFAAVTAVAGAGNTTHRPGIHNGVITACVEPPTKGNRATSGDLNFLVCLKGARKVSWNVRGAARPTRPHRCAGRPRASRSGRCAGRPGASRSGTVRRALKGQQVPLARPVRQGPPRFDRVRRRLHRGRRTNGDLVAIPNTAYPIALGSPVADTTGGVFRFTCTAARGILHDRSEDGCAFGTDIADVAHPARVGMRAATVDHREPDTVRVATGRRPGGWSI